jgi:hypothetical protein
MRSWPKIISLTISDLISGSFEFSNKKFKATSRFDSFLKILLIQNVALLLSHLLIMPTRDAVSFHSTLQHIHRALPSMCNERFRISDMQQKSDREGRKPLQNNVLLQRTSVG